MKKTQNIDLTPYVQGFVLAFRRPSIFAMPLLAGVVDLVLTELSYLFTDPIGQAGAGIFLIISRLVYLWAFGVAIVQANNIWRGHRGTFDEAWEEGRSRLGDIAFAAIGFYFVVSAAGYIGSYLGLFGLLLPVVAAVFLIYTLPAGAIGGLPGSLAISGSIRAVRATPMRAIILAIVCFALWAAVSIGLSYFLVTLPPMVGKLVSAAASALILGYLALPFAKEYDDIAFTTRW